MSIPDTNGSTTRGGVKTLAIRLEPDLHAQLTLIAQLRGATITDEIKAAIEDRIKAAKNQSELAGKAEAALAEIEREAANRRDALAALFGTTEPPAQASDGAAPPTDPDSGKPGGRRSGSGRSTG
jgi:predicted DNA-binding protein